MRATEQFFTLVRKTRELNAIDSQLIIETYAKYDPKLYKDLATIYRAIIDINLPDADLLIAQLSCEVGNGHVKEVKGLLMKELTEFINWYEPNMDVIDENFSYDAISDIIDDEAKRAFAFEMLAAEKKVEKASEDKNVWHELAKAYGSCVYGDKTYKDLNQEDMNCIRGPLERYESHFNVKVTDFEKMYADYHSIGLHLVDKAKDEYMVIRKNIEKYKNSLQKEYIEDVYLLFFDFLYPYYSFLSGDENHLPVLTQADITTQPLKEKRGYGKYNSLEECIPDISIVNAIDSWADDYYKRYHEIDTIFGRQVFNFVKENDFLNKKNCARNHFGDLLIKRYETKCSFINGKSLEGENKHLDGELGILINSFLDSYTKEHTPKEK